MKIKPILIQFCLLCAILLPVFTTEAQLTVTHIATGADHSLFTKSDGSLWGMGYNGDGELGDGTTNNTAFPEQIIPGGVTAIAAGSSHSLFIKTDGSLWAMGFNQYGQLGNGGNSSVTSPVQVMASNVVAIAAGENHSLFLKTDGSLWGMGDNQFGQLGDGTTTPRNLPVQIAPNSARVIAAGGNHSLYLTKSGNTTRLWTMGDNTYGELGDGTTNNRPTPTNILTGNIATTGVVTAIAAGLNHSLFLKNDGSLWVMGDNEFFQLGDARFSTFTNVPEKIVSGNVMAIAAGCFDSLFIESDGSLWGMGLSESGELGSEILSFITPRTIQPGGFTATAVSAGFMFNLFIESDGTLWGMGDDTYGQLGDRAFNTNGVFPAELIITAPPPALGITIFSNQPVVIFPSVGTNYILKMTTNLASGVWVTVTNGVPFNGVQITNAPSNAFFKLQ